MPRVYEIAKLLGITNKEIIEHLNLEGATHMTMIEDAQMEAMMDAIELDAGNPERDLSELKELGPDVDVDGLPDLPMGELREKVKFMQAMINQERAKKEATA